MTNFYREYLKDAAKTQAPLHELLKGAKKKDRKKVHWTDNSRRSFEKCKTELAEAALLSFLRSGLPLSLCTDTSDLAVSAVLQQLENEGWKPIAFYSKKLNETQTRFEVPAKLFTDQGRQFEAELFRSLAAISGAKVAHTTSYHPQCNGKVERLHRTLKGATKAHNIRWAESLPTVLLGLRAAKRPDISYTIAQMWSMTETYLFVSSGHNQNEQTGVGQKNETSNLKELSPLPDEQSTTSCGRKIKKIPNATKASDIGRSTNQAKRRREERTSETSKQRKLDKKEIEITLLLLDH
ncbi:transposon Ty3-I Gag-Pol polyprotein [Trichonephila clavipes]|nr:transposon Ty3-I Gag-Pol polyprotein [Trichonephila clavipes]